MYHSIGDSSVLFTVFPSDFERQMVYLKKNNFRVVSLGDLSTQLKNGNALRDKTVALTFDDGFKDNFTDAWPVIKKYNFPATIFLPTAYIGSLINNSQNLQQEVLNEGQIREMSGSGLVEFGSHTHNHPRLEKISDDEFEKEISESKEVIKQITGKPCRFFAYPKGFFKASFEPILEKNGYEAACLTQEGLISNGDNLFKLKRNFVYSKGGFEQFKGKLNYSVVIFNFLKRLV